MATLIINTEAPSNNPYNLQDIDKIVLSAEHSDFGTGNLSDMIKSVKVVNNVMNVVIENVQTSTLKFTNFSNIANISMEYGEFTREAGELAAVLNTKNALNTITKPTSGTTVSGTILNDTVNVSSYKVPTSGKNKGKGLTINSGNGNDKITGTKGADTINAGNGNDNINAGLGNDIIKAGAGNDTITAAKGNDKIYFEKGNNTAIFNNGDGADIVYKGSGSDTLKFTGFANVSKLKSGISVAKLGNNLILKYNSAKDSVTISDFFKSGTSVKKLMAKDGSNIELSAFLNSKTFSFTGKKNKANSITGTTYNDIIKGDSKNDNLNGGNGNDKIYGYAGADTLKAGNGNDQLWGGKGNDKIYFEKGNNTAIFANGDGNDTVYKGSGSDTLKFTGYTNLTKLKSGMNIVKSDNNLVLKYNSAKDSVTIPDFFKSGTSVKTLMANNGEKIDLTAFINYKTINLTGAKNKANTINGTAYNDIIKGDSKNDSLIGGDGNDRLYGYAGVDTIKGGNGNDTLYGGTGNDKIYTGAGTNTVVINKGDGNDIIYHQGDKTTLQIGSANAKDSMSFTKNANNLVLTYTHVKAKGEKTNVKEVVTIANYFNSDGSVKSDNIYLKTTENKKISEFIKSKGLNITGSGTINGTVLNDIITGSGNNDTINSGIGNDKVYAGAGNDVIYSSLGKTTIEGGAGNDTIFIQEESTGSRINYYWASTNKLQNNGHDVIYGSSVKDTLYINIGNRSLTQEFIKSGDDLIVEFYDGHVNTATRNPGGSITIKDYYAQEEENRLDNIIIHNDCKDGDEDGLLAYGDNSLSLREVIGWYQDGMLNSWKDEGNGDFDENGRRLYEGTDGDDILTGSVGDDVLISNGGCDTITAGNGNDIIDLTDGFGEILSEGSVIRYIWADGSTMQSNAHDRIIGATNKDTIYLELGNIDMLPRFEQDENDLKLLFCTQDRVVGSITIENYFVEPEPELEEEEIIDNRIDKLIVHSNLNNSFEFANGENEYSIKALITKYGLDGFAEGDIIGTNGNDNLSGILNENNKIYGYAGDDAIFTMGGENHVWAGRGNDDIHINNDDTVEGGIVVENRGTTVYFDYTQNDGKDLILGATEIDTLNITTGDLDNVNIRCKNVGGALQIGFYDKTSNTDNKLQTITIQDYFAAGDSNELRDPEHSIRNLILNGEEHLITELSFDDVIYAQEDIIQSGNGSEVIFCNNNGNDVICGDGNDIVYGGDGDDFINGLFQRSVYNIGRGSKRLYGGGGNDTIHSGYAGITEIRGGKGNDVIYTDLIRGEAALKEQIEGRNNCNAEKIGNSVYADVIDGNGDTHHQSVGYYVTEDAGSIYYYPDAEQLTETANIYYDYTNGGDGHDTIYMGYDSDGEHFIRSRDSIYIKLGTGNVTTKNVRKDVYDNEGNLQSRDLVIQFYENGIRNENNSITIKDYFTRSNNSKIKNIYFNNTKSDEFTRALSQEGDWTYNQDLYLHVGDERVGGDLFGDDKIYVEEGAEGGIEYRFDIENIGVVGGTDTIYGATNRNPIGILSTGDLDFTYQRRKNDPDKKYDLEINMQDAQEHSGTIILKDYFKQADNIRLTKFFLNGVEHDFSDEIENLFDNEPQNDMNEINLNDDNPIYVFNPEDFTNDEYNCLEIKNQGNEPKTIQFNELDFNIQDNTLSFEYEPLYEGNNENGITDNINIKAYTNTEYGEVCYTMRYVDYLKPEGNKQLIVQVDEDTYYVDSLNATVDYNWSEGDDADYNHVVFVQADKFTDDEPNVSTIISNDMTNVINTNGGAALNYTYGEGCDIVNACSQVSDDTYNVDFTDSTTLSILDEGGQDTLNILSSVDDVRLFFLYRNEQQGNIELSEYEDNDDYNMVFLIHKNCFETTNDEPNTYETTALETISYMAEGTMALGVIQINAKKAEDEETEGCLIETITSQEIDEETEELVETPINTNAWYGYIAERVAGWFGEHNYSSIQDVFESENETDINSLLAAYDISYKDAMELI